MSSFVVGIDPDKVKSGVAAVELDGSIRTLDNMDLFSLVAFIEEHKDQAHFALEDVNAIKPTFPRSAKGKPLSKAVVNNISQKVGMVKCAGYQIEEALKKAGAQYTLVKPLCGSAKAVKKNSDLFNRTTGWSGRSNEDQRDAAMIGRHVAAKLKADRVRQERHGSAA